MRTLPLAEELVRVRARFRGVPSPAALAGLQAAADRADGLPHLAAQAMAGYTLTPLAGRGPTDSFAAGGRRGTAIGGGTVTSHGHLDPWTSIDLRVLTPLLAAGFRVGGSHLAFVRDLVQQLAADAASDADPAAAWANAVAVAEASEAWAAPTRIAVRSAPAAAELVLETTLDGPVDIAAQVAMLLGARLVHGRIGAVTGAEPSSAPVVLWEVSRRISPACLAFVTSLLDASRRGATADPAVVEAGVAIGLPRGPLATNIPRLVELLGPVAPRMPSGGDGAGPPDDVGPRTVGPDTIGRGVREVPDGLGVLYALSDLLAVRAVASTI
ncbi:MAG: hypothetical protein JWM47_1721 [Acidimicrobiales bacterium]|nr:hypothetical protein [Acidimicrobiales bacterium]